MGLDQYAYVASKAGQRDEFYDQAGIRFDPKTGEWVVPAGGMRQPRQISYWRKHPNLQGWMENLWEQKMQATGEDNPHTFNGIELELTWEDIDRLEKDIKAGTVAQLATTGFFFGDPSDEYYKEQDLEFCLDAKTELFLGLKVFYNSSW